MQPFNPKHVRFLELSKGKYRFNISLHAFILLPGRGIFSYNTLSEIVPSLAFTIVIACLLQQYSFVMIGCQVIMKLSKGSGVLLYHQNRCRSQPFIKT